MCGVYPAEGMLCTACKKLEKNSGQRAENSASVAVVTDEIDVEIRKCFGSSSYGAVDAQLSTNAMLHS